MYNVMFIYETLLCGNDTPVKLCDDYSCDLCFKHLERDGDVVDYSTRQNCKSSNKKKNGCLIVKTDDMFFSGISYDSRFNPKWYLKLTEKKFDSEHYKMLALCVENTFLYDYKRDDLKYWYSHHKDLCDELYDFHEMNNCHSYYWMQEDDRLHRNGVPCNEKELYKFLNYIDPKWREISLKRDYSNPFKTA